MTGLKTKLQSARITNVDIKAQRFKALLKDTRQLDWVNAKTAQKSITPKTQKTTVDLVYNSISSASANTAAVSVRVMRILCVISALNWNAERERRSAESAQREKKCLELVRFVNYTYSEMANVHNANRRSVISSARCATDTLRANQVSYVLFAVLGIRWEIARLLIIIVRCVESTDMKKAYATTARVKSSHKMFYTRLSTELFNGSVEPF
jgi:hypothetical protein